MNYLLFCFVCLFVYPFYSQTGRSVAREANQYYYDSLYVDAEVKYKKSLIQNHSSNEVKFNLANTLIKQGRFEDAENLLNDVIFNSSDSILVSEAYYNAGNSFLQQNKISEAVNAYKNCLRINPDDEQARYNLSKSLSLLNNQKNNDNNQDKQNDDKEESQNSGQTDGDKDDSKNNNKKDNKSPEESGENNNSDSNSSNNSDSKDEKNNNIVKQNGELSNQEIERMLDALNREEQRTQKKIKKVQVTNKKKKTEKDW